MAFSPESSEHVEIGYSEASGAQATPRPLGYDLLMQPLGGEPTTGVVSFEPNQFYEDYLLLHKVFLGQHGAMLLEQIHDSLSKETMPRYLGAAGWAAVEAAIIQSEKPIDERQELLRSGVDCWQRALQAQKVFNANGPECLAEASYPYRIAFDLAVVPLVEHMLTQGTVPLHVRREVYKDCLNIAQANGVRTNLMLKEGNVEGLGDHIGFGYEANALLAFNLRCSKGWFVIPSMARSDTGYHHRQQTHDLVVVHHRNGKVLNLTPVEIKSTINSNDRERYKALLVRGKMHLSQEGLYTPDHTLSALEAVFENRPSKSDLAIVGEVTDRFVEMVRDYCAGEALGQVATARSITRFRDTALVHAKHPGLSGLAAS